MNKKKTTKKKSKTAKLAKKPKKKKKVVKKKISKVLPQYISKAEFARQMGLVGSTISLMLRMGDIKSTMVGRKEMIEYRVQKATCKKLSRFKDRTDLFPSNAEPEAEVQDSNPVDEHKRGRDNKINNISDANFQLAKYKAQKAKEEYEEFIGMLVPMEDVKKAWGDVATALKKSILALPARIGPLLAGETDVHTVKTMLKSELTRCLNDTVDKYKPEEKKKRRKK